MNFKSIELSFSLDQCQGLHRLCNESSGVLLMACCSVVFGLKTAKR